MIDRIIESDAELKENYAIITSIKGVARQNGACLLIFTNNFRRFDLDARKIACYYGVAPFGKESGTSIHSPAKTSHFANKLIKALLGQAAHCAKIFNPEIRDYYNRLVARGKKPQVALNNVKNKLIRIIVALVRKKVYYDPKTYMFYSLKDSGIRDLANAVGIVVARDQARHADISTTNKYLQGSSLTVHEETKHFEGHL